MSSLNKVQASKFIQSNLLPESSQSDVDTATNLKNCYCYTKDPSKTDSLGSQSFTLAPVFQIPMLKND